MATWKIHIQDAPRSHGSNAFSKAARRASMMKKRRFSKNLTGLGNHIASGDRKGSEGSIVFAPGDESRTSSISG
jgi:hypothetical protein